MLKKASLACTVCGSRNYSISLSQQNARAERLEVKKFCKVCKKHTLHKETR
ncbi:MAG: 50S ribosomal protein L33 [Streptococcaceae bacterium]|nr:50S ribosomal protein L33 [Streptococcaceae bacterium]